MAGEWIKMRADLQEDPAVFKLAAILKTDRLQVIGHLYAFWVWADKHAVDGRVDGASTHVVDDVVRRLGFSDALVSVKWLEAGDDFVAIPKFERHNGSSAKERSLKNQRQARWRDTKPVDGGEPNAPSTSASTRPSTEPSTREEKRRSNTPLPPKGATNVHGFPPGFEAFWSIYPKKAGKKAAAHAYAKAKPDDALQAIIVAAVERQKQSPQWAKDAGQFVPNAATWLNGERWLDEVDGQQSDAFAGAL